MADNPFKRKPAVSRALKQIQDYSAERKGFSKALDSSDKRVLRPSQRDFMKKLKDSQARGADARARAQIQSGSGTFTDRLPDAKKSRGPFGTLTVRRETPVVPYEKPGTAVVPYEPPTRGVAPFKPQAATGAAAAGLRAAGASGIARFLGPVGALIGMTTPAGEGSDKPPKGKDALMKGRKTGYTPEGKRMTFDQRVAAGELTGAQAMRNSISGPYDPKRQRGPQRTQAIQGGMGMAGVPTNVKRVSGGFKGFSGPNLERDVYGSTATSPLKPELRPKKDAYGSSAVPPPKPKPRPKKDDALAKTKVAKRKVTKPAAAVESPASKKLASAPKYKDTLGFTTGTTIRQNPSDEKRLRAKFEKSRNK